MIKFECARKKDDEKVHYSLELLPCDMYVDIDGNFVIERNGIDENGMDITIRFNPEDLLRLTEEWRMKVGGRFPNIVGVADRFLRKQATVGELRRAVKMAKQIGK